MMTDYEKIIDHYGKDKQLRKWWEEVIELRSALDGFGDILDEVADNFVMLEHIITIYNLDHKQIFDRMEFKIKRQLERIAREVAENESSRQKEG